MDYYVHIYKNLPKSTRIKSQIIKIGFKLKLGLGWLLKLKDIILVYNFLAIWVILTLMYLYQTIYVAPTL